jgi:hypothetical protein
LGSIGFGLHGLLRPNECIRRERSIDKSNCLGSVLLILIRTHLLNAAALNKPLRLGLHS